MGLHIDDMRMVVENFLENDDENFLGKSKNKNKTSNRMMMKSFIKKSSLSRMSTECSLPISDHSDK
jgi:hypothetical protein